MFLAHLLLTIHPWWVPNISACSQYLWTVGVREFTAFFPPVSLSFLGHLSFGFLLCFVLTFFSLDLPCLLYVQRDRGCHSMASQRPREQSTWGKWYVILEGCIDLGPFFWNPQLELQALWCCKVLLIQCIWSVVDVFGLMVVVYWSKGDGVFGLLVLVYLISMW